jgi:hypothetical protein
MFSLIFIVAIVAVSTVNYMNAEYGYIFPHLISGNSRLKIEVYNERNESMYIQTPALSGFGMRLPDFGGLQVYLAIADPIDACSTIKSPPVVSYINKWIALIEDNICVKKCSLEQKVFNAQNAGYAAVIIYSQDFTMNELAQRPFNNFNYQYNFKIPTFFTENSNAETLKKFSFESKSYLRIFKNEFLVILDYILVAFIVYTLLFGTIIFIFLFFFMLFFFSLFFVFISNCFVLISLNIIVWALEKLNQHCHIIYKKDIQALHGIIETILKKSEKFDIIDVLLLNRPLLLLLVALLLLFLNIKHLM